MSTHEHTPECHHLLAQLSDYIDGDLEAALCAELEQHLAGCEDCRVMVDTTRKTVTLYRTHGQVDLPPGALNRLWQAMGQRGECYPTGGPADRGESETSPRKNLPFDS